MRFENEVVVVTGGASGIGRAVCQAAAAEGARVAVLDMNESAGAALADEIGGVFLACDVGDHAQWQANVRTIIGELGPPDRVHLNAGIMSAPTGQSDEAYSFASATPDSYRRITSANIDGVIFGLQAVLPHMKEGSNIVVTASVAGLNPFPYDPIYAMTKHAMVGLVRSLGPELESRGIRINAICPGGVATAITPTGPQHKMMFSGPQMSPEDLAADVLNLFDGEGTGDTWARIGPDRPAFVMYPPGARPRD